MHSFVQAYLDDFTSCPMPNYLYWCLVSTLLFMILNISFSVRVSLSLTIKNVAEKLTDVDNPVKLKSLGVWLNVPHSEHASLHCLLTYFMEKHPFGSWRTLIWALDAIKEHSIADKIRSYAEEVIGYYYYKRNQCVHIVSPHFDTSYP